MRRPYLWMLLLVLAAAIGYFGLDVLKHEWQMYQLVSAVSGIPMHARCERLTVRSAFGLLTGNSNHCDYFAGMLLRTDDTPDSVLKHYHGQTILNPVSGTHEEIEVRVLTGPESLDDAWLPDEFKSLGSWSQSPRNVEDSTIVLVYFMRSYPPDTDCRCR